MSQKIHYEKKKPPLQIQQQRHSVNAEALRGLRLEGHVDRPSFSGSPQDCAIPYTSQRMDTES
jgi:hypothetical protein